MIHEHRWKKSTEVICWKLIGCIGQLFWGASELKENGHLCNYMHGLVDCAELKVHSSVFYVIDFYVILVAALDSWKFS